MKLKKIKIKKIFNCNKEKNKNNKFFLFIYEINLYKK